MRSLGATLIIAALTAACSGKAAAPTAPSSPQGVPAAQGGPSTPGSATIAGSIKNTGAGGTVSIAATAMSATVDGAGRFTLTNVPAGDVQLQIRTASASGVVPITGVQPAEVVEVVVTVAGGAATLESEVRHGAGEAELKGTVEALPPSTPALTFRAAETNVRTDSSTVFVNGSMIRSFSDLRVGMRVEVKGSLSGDTFTASRVELEDVAEAPEPEPAERELNGTIAGLSGTASAFSFMLGSTLVKGDASTALAGSGEAPKTFAALQNGTVVEIHGVQHVGFVQASRIHIEDAENEPPEDRDEVEVQGMLGAVSGTCPAISSTVGSTTFTTSASTRFDDAACSAFKAGDKVEVKGTRNADGSLAASRLKKDS